MSKVTLKVGDVFHRAYTACWFDEDFTIASFHGREIKYLNGTYEYFSGYGEYIVNGCHYVAEDVLLPHIDIINQENHDSDCSLHNEPASPNGECDLNYSCEDITADNLWEVLRYNNICQSKYEFSNTGIFLNEHNRIELSNPNLIKHVELELGKLKPLPKLTFDFLNYMQGNGFELFRFEGDGRPQLVKNTVIITYVDGEWNLNTSLKSFEPTIENADIIISLVHLLEYLK